MASGQLSPFRAHLATVVFNQTLLCIAVGLLLPLAGCRTPDPSVELLESELRWMEDNLYMLDDQLERCCEQLESARRNNAALRTQLAEAQTQATASPTPTPADRKSNDDAPFDEESMDDLLSIPKVEVNPTEEELPSDTKTRGAVDGPPAGQIELQGTPNLESIRKSVPESTTDDPFEDAEPRDNSVERILLNQRLTGGYDFDGRPGHEGLLVVIEPQNGSRQYVATPGELIVEVTNPAADPVQSQVARWDFDAIEAAALMKESLFGRGIHLKLPWPGAPPSQEELSLSVTFETPDGRQLRANRKLLLSPPSAEIVARTPDANSSPLPAAPAWSPHR